MKNLILLALIFTVSACDDYGMKATAPTEVIPTPTPAPTPNPACTTCRIFLSDTNTDAAFGGAPGADAICAADANKPATGIYKALLMDSTRNQNLDWVLHADTDYVRASDNAFIVRTNTSKVISFTNAGGNVLTNSMDMNFEYIWTGIQIDSISAWSTSSTCSNWTSNSSSDQGISADTISTDYVAISSGPDNCSFSFYRILCVEQ